MCLLCGTEPVNRGASTNQQEHQEQQQQQQQQQQHQSGDMSHENVQPMHIGHPLAHRTIYSKPSNKRPKLWQKPPLPTPPPTTTYNYSEIDERIRELDAKIKKAWAVIAAYRKNMAKYRQEIGLLGRHKQQQQQQQQQQWQQRAATASAENFPFLDTSHMFDK